VPVLAQYHLNGRLNRSLYMGGCPTWLGSLSKLYYPITDCSQYCTVISDQLDILSLQTYYHVNAHDFPVFWIVFTHPFLFKHSISDFILMRHHIYLRDYLELSIQTFISFIPLIITKLIYFPFKSIFKTINRISESTRMLHACFPPSKTIREDQNLTLRSPEIWVFIPFLKLRRTSKVC